MRRIVLIYVLTTLATGAWAQGCFVVDPTGGPLSVRAYPHGPIRGTLNNDIAVEIHQRTYDKGGEPWVYVTPVAPGQSGWVLENNLACDD